MNGSMIDGWLDGVVGRYILQPVNLRPKRLTAETTEFGLSRPRVKSA